MDPDRWERMQRILAGTLDLPGTRRYEYLRGESDGDPELLLELEALLAAAEATHGPIEHLGARGSPW